MRRKGHLTFLVDTLIENILPDRRSNIQVVGRMKNNYLDSTFGTRYAFNCISPSLGCFAGLGVGVTSVVSISPLSNPKRNKFG